MCREGQILHYSYLYHYISVCFDNSINFINMCVTSSSTVSIIKGFVYYCRTLVSSYKIALPGTLRWAFSETKAQSSGYTHKNEIQVFGKFIHYLNVFKSTPDTRTFKDSL